MDDKHYKTHYCCRIQTEDEVEIIDGTILKGDIETSDDPTVFISDDFETLLGQDEEIR